MLNSMIEEQRVKIQSMEGIIIQLLSSIAVVPPDVLTNLSQIGIEVEVMQLDNDDIGGQSELYKTFEGVTNEQEFPATGENTSEEVDPLGDEGQDNVLYDTNTGSIPCAESVNITDPSHFEAHENVVITTQASTHRTGDSTNSAVKFYCSVCSFVCEQFAGLMQHISEAHVQARHDKNIMQIGRPRCKGFNMSQSDNETDLSVCRRKKTAKTKTYVDENDEDDSIKRTSYVSRSGRKCKRLKIGGERSQENVPRHVANVKNSDESQTEELESNDQVIKPETQQKTESTNYSCSIKKCETVCSSAEELIKHVNEMHSDDKRWTCHNCKQMFATWTEKDKHAKVCYAKNSRVGPFVCELCGKEGIPDMTKLKDHLYQHRRRLRDKQKKQNMCLNGDSLGRPPQLRLPCDICGKQITREGMKNHVKTHIKPTVCELCGAGFATKMALRVHKIRVHEDISLAKYKCDHCGQLFVELSKCKIHVTEVHNTEYDIKCGVCHKAFPSQRYLQSHMKTTHADKPHKCHLCSAAFGLKALLTRHVKFVHLKNTTFYCSMCKIKFDSHTNLTAHKNTSHAGEFKYCCLVCSKGFNRRYYYRNHLANCHNMETTILDNKDMRVTMAMDDNVDAASGV